MHGTRNVKLINVFVTYNLRKKKHNAKGNNAHGRLFPRSLRPEDINACHD